MNFLKKIVAVFLVAAIAAAFTGCHQKDEIAVKVGELEFTSAYYMCALIFADSEAKTIVDEGLSESESSAEVNYFEKKVEDTDYVKWVKDKALENIKKAAAYKILSKEAGIELESDVVSNVESYASYYWAYGYQTLLEPNGVSYETYKKYMLDTSYAELYFEHLYAEGGEKEISAADVKAKMLDNFILVDMIEVTFSEETDEQKKEIKDKFEGYRNALEGGTKTFEQVYTEHNPSEEEHNHDAEEETEETKPVNPHATVLGGKDTDSPSDYFEDAAALADGKVKLIEKEGETGYVLMVRRSLETDKYYAENLDITVRHLIADEEFDKDMEEHRKGVTLETVKRNIDQFNVKKIKYPES